jgi:hypothetical protein
VPESPSTEYYAIKFPPFRMLKFNYIKDKKLSFLNEIEALAIQVADVSFSTEKKRNTDVIKKRFSLAGEGFYTLDEIGKYYDVTRERIRQIEVKVLKNIRKVLAGDVLKGGFSASNAIILEFENLKMEIYEQDYILIEKEFVKFICDKYGVGFESKYLYVIYLILELLGYFKLPSKIIGYSGEIYDFWYLSDNFDRGSIENVFKSLNKYRSRAEKIKIFDLVVSAKRQFGEGISKELLHLILKACPDYQKIDEENIEVRFDSLPSLAEKAFRVLEYFNEPKHYSDILREINFRLSNSESKSLATDVSLKNQMISDKRFVSIGKSGYWALKTWSSVSTKSITELMEIHLHKANCPQTIDQIYEYVASQRPGVSKQSIKTYLYDKPQFSRTGEGQYSLLSWGVTTVSKAKLSSIDVSNRIKELAEEVFSTHSTISNSELVSFINEKSGLSEATIRKAIKSCKEIEVVSSQGKSNILRCNDLRLASLSTAVSKVLLREKVQGKVLDIMNSLEGRRIQKIELYRAVSKEVECIRPTFYRYLSEMTIIKQFMNDGRYYCEMAVNKPKAQSISYLDLSPLEICPDTDVIDNVIKATDKLNERDVDIGLFELGRIFENVVKKYLEYSRDNNLFVVTKNDLERLVSMISCLERNRDKMSVKFKQHHLTLLREDRNLRAHDEIPSKQERLVILAKAPFVVEMFIDYIVKFSRLVSGENLNDNRM